MNPDIIRLSGLQIETIIGILPLERVQPQPLILDLELELDLSQAALCSDLERTIDYARLADDAAAIVQAAGFKLLESAALALCHYLLTPPVGTCLPVMAARVTLSKPQALAGRALPSVSLRRSLEQVTISNEQHGEAEVTRIYETAEVTLLRLHRWPSDGALPATRPYTECHDLVLAPQVRLLVLR